MDEEEVSVREVAVEPYLIPAEEAVEQALVVELHGPHHPIRLSFTADVVVRDVTHKGAVDFRVLCRVGESLIGGVAVQKLLLDGVQAAVDVHLTVTGLEEDVAVDTCSDGALSGRAGDTGNYGSD